MPFDRLHYLRGHLRRAGHPVTFRVALGMMLGLVPALVPAAAAQDRVLASLQETWTARRYPEALSGLLEYRRTAPNGRNVAVDYMIATSACRVRQQEDLGRRMFTWILARYRLDAQGRSSIEAERRRCPPSTGVVVPVNVGLITTGPSVSSRVSGKMFYSFTDGGGLQGADPENVGLTSDS